MKLYLAAIGPNSTAVVDYLKLKKIEIPQQVIDIVKNENRTDPEYSKVTVFKTVPCLVLDNGFGLSENVAIIEYLEEKHPANPLIGSTAEERAETRMWWRFVDLQVSEPLLEAFRYSDGIKLFETRFRVIPEAAAGLKGKVQDKLKFIDGLLASKQFLAGDRFTVADLWLYHWVTFGANMGQPLNPDNKHLAAYLERVKAKIASA